MTPRMLYTLARVLAALTVIPFHEAGHALAAWLLGDPTAKQQGRLSLNPFRHFDLLGTLCMVFAGVGWAKPVSTDPRNFKNPKQGMALTALAGPAANLILAYLAMVVWKLLYYWAPVNDATIFLALFLQYFSVSGREPRGVQPHPGAAAGRQPRPAGCAARAHLLRHDEV
ncbi:MAG: site-2 protease family protein [Faecalibacterium prausnitzii]